MAKFKIPVYSNLQPKQKQWVNMILGGCATVGVVLFASGFLGGPPTVKGIDNAGNLPKPRSLGSVPGQALDSKDAWIGGAAKDVTRMREDVRAINDKLLRQQEAQQRTNDDLKRRLDLLVGSEGRSNADIDAKIAAAQNAAALQAARNGAAESGRPAPAAAARAATAHPTQAPMPAATSPVPANEPQSLGAQPRTGRLPGAQASPGQPGAYPPGVPNGQGPLMVAEQAPSPMAGLVRVSARSQSPDVPKPDAPKGAGVAAAAGGAAAPAAGNAPGSAQGVAMRKVDTYLPVSHTRAVLLGGLAAPTGGQAQSNPVPVLLRLVDAAVLPNHFRGLVQDCLVVAEGFGDQSAERAYIRTTLLSCVMRDGTVIEVPVKGSVFGEDGMNGLRGALVTKQGQILTNALLAGIASGLGNGIAQSTQQITNTALGATTTNPTDGSGILKQGIGTGVGKALDRLSQYYIALAEKTFPVIEIQPGRTVDVVITQGVQLDLTYVNGKATSSAAPTKGSEAARKALLKTVTTGGDDEESE